MPGQFSVTIQNLNNGGQLGCNNDIEVGYTQPDNVGSSTLSLSTDAAGAQISPGSFTVTATSGTVSFGVRFPRGTSLTGRTVTATISNGGAAQASDVKSNISVACARADAGGTDEGSSD